MAGDGRQNRRHQHQIIDERLRLHPCVIVMEVRVMINGEFFCVANESCII